MAALTADRDLLFGLLALQNGLIDEGQLVAAFRAWTRDRGTPLADHLVARGDVDDEQRAAVGAMAALLLKKYRDDVGTGLGTMAVGPSTRARLAELDDLDLTA